MLVIPKESIRKSNIMMVELRMDSFGMTTYNLGFSLNRQKQRTQVNSSFFRATLRSILISSLNEVNIDRLVFFLWCA